MHTIMRIAAAAVLAWAVAATSSPVAAQDGETAMVRLLQSNVELRGQVQGLTASVDAMKAELQELRRSIENGSRKGGDPVVTTGAVKPAPAPVSKTAVCQCQGSNRGVCFCLQNGIACKCNSGKGSVWNLNEQGRAVSKTGQYADPRKAAAAPKPAPVPQQQFVVRPPMVMRNCPNCRRYRSDD